MLMPSEHDQSPDTEREPMSERKPYHEPELVRHGTVAEVTKAGSSTPDNSDANTDYAS
jgi:hypothetical protein